MTVLEFLKSRVNYPLTDAQVESICIKRGLDKSEEVDQMLACSPMLQLAYADTLVFIVTMTNISQGGSVSAGNTTSMLSIANKIYIRNGEQTVDDSVTTFKVRYW